MTNPSTQSTQLNASDLESLIREPTPEGRARIAERICAGYNGGGFSANEMKLALEIFRLLLKDSEARVRQVMAEELKENITIPHDIIWALAHDEESVAVPVLRSSMVLSEDDLIKMVHATREIPKLIAIAQRESLSKPLSHALIETRQHDVTREVLANPGAALADSTTALVLDEFAKDSSVLEAMVHRGGLPYDFAEKLFSLVSDGLKKQLTRKYNMNKHVVEEASDASRETAVLQFLSPWMSQNEIQKLVDHMHKNKRLTDSVIIRSLCIGDLRFFETALAKLVGIPASNARLLMFDPGPLGFRALYASAQLPKDFYPAVRIMLQLALEETEYGTYRNTDFCQRMIERITAEGYAEEVPHIDTMLSIIGRSVARAPTLH
jgi:uncharacterized protein (DUF2336 family)